MLAAAYNYGPVVLGVLGGVIAAMIGAWVGAKLTSTSERDDEERRIAREAIAAFEGQANVRLREIELLVAKSATSQEVNRLSEKVGLVESRVAGIESVLRLVDPRLRPGGMAQTGD